METRTKDDDEEDFVQHLFTAQAQDYLMFFTNSGRVYVERVYELPEASRASRGRSIKNVLNLQPDESIAAVLRLVYVTDDDGNDITFSSDALLNPLLKRYAHGSCRPSSWSFGWNIGTNYRYLQRVFGEH